MSNPEKIASHHMVHAERARVCGDAEEDRRERRRRLGLPEELTEEEKAAEAAKKAAAAKAQASSKLPVKPISLITQLRDTLVRAHLPRHVRRALHVASACLASEH